MSDIQKLTRDIIAFRDVRDWEQFHNPKDLALSLVLEAAEVMEHFQWKSPEEVERHIKECKEDLGDELADVLGYILLIAHTTNIDLVTAFERKLEKNDKKYPVEKARGKATKYTRL